MTLLNTRFALLSDSNKRSESLKSIQTALKIVVLVLKDRLVKICLQLEQSGQRLDWRFHLGRP